MPRLENDDLWCCQVNDCVSGVFSPVAPYRAQAVVAENTPSACPVFFPGNAGSVRGRRRVSGHAGGSSFVLASTRACSSHASPAASTQDTPWGVVTIIVQVPSAELSISRICPDAVSPIPVGASLYLSDNWVSISALLLQTICELALDTPVNTSNIERAKII